MSTSRPLVVACGALARDLRVVLAGTPIEVAYLPANLHNAPDEIVSAVAPLVDGAVDAGRSVFVAYADCGTGGRLDAFLATRPGVERLPGAHCYETFAGTERFEALQREELGSFYLTDFLALHFDALVWRGLGLDRAPQLLPSYFGRYRRVVHLAQDPDTALAAPVVQAARAAAARLGLPYERRDVGRRELAVALRVA